MKITTSTQVKDSFDIPFGDSPNLMFKDVKLDNVLVNYREGDIRFSDVKLGDLGGACLADSTFAKEGTPV
jgi:hypothetical protein